LIGGNWALTTPMNEGVDRSVMLSPTMLVSLAGERVTVVVGLIWGGVVLTVKVR